ncbi:MAG: aldo/keto reductase [Clostridia bacterium]|nr:aldo/keto reductase [Clostridia bacterium]
MHYIILGNTGLKVSRICFGALTIGPNQRNLSLEEGSKVIIKALEMGINFIDTAKTYGTYPYIARALAAVGGRGNIVLASKSHAYTEAQMKKDLFECLKSLKISEIDIFLLHEQQNRYTLKGHRPALEFLLKAKEKGYVRAVGISSHTVEAVSIAAEMPEIDVIHPLINIKGIGICDGTRDEMLLAIKKAYDNGKGIYAMKPFGGGHLIPNAREALQWVLGQSCIHSVAVGMQSEDEVKVNVIWASGEDVDEDVLARLKTKKRRITVADWCLGCGRCVERCTSGAVEIINQKACISEVKCILCSYCAMVCPEFCIKIF